MLKKINTPLAFDSGIFLAQNMKRPVILYLKSRYAPFPQWSARYSAAGIYFANEIVTEIVTIKGGPSTQNLS